jgi:iron complex transport system permease protein
MRTERARPALALAVGVVALGAAVLASLALGAGALSPPDALAALLGSGAVEDVVVVRDLRLPRTVLAAAVGAALGVGGLLVQTVSRNPLAEPGLLGVTAGAGFAITVGVLAGVAATPVAQLVLALAGALVAAVLVLAVGRSSPLRLVLAGMATTSVLSGLSLGLRLIDPATFDRFRVWTVGSLAGREQVPLALPLMTIVVALLAVLPLLRSLGTLALGDQVAHAVGTRVGWVRGAALALVTVLTAAATAAAGPITFVGLMVPHLARWVARGSLVVALAVALIGGPLLLVLADVLARLLLPSGEVPVAVVTAFLGGPVLVWAVRRLPAGVS